MSNTSKPEPTKKPGAKKKQTRRQAMPVVHFEIIGRHPKRLRRYYAKLFGWEFDTAAPVARKISKPGNYGFIAAPKTSRGPGIPGGIGGGKGYRPHTIFYVGVPDVKAALRQAEKLGGKRRLGPVVNHGTGLAVAHFTDPEGQLIGIAGPA